MSCSASQDGTLTTSVEFNTQASSERETTVSPTLMRQDESSRSSQRADSSASSSSSSSSSSGCLGEERIEIKCFATNCTKTASKSRKHLFLPWKCKYHRNKTYKETYKKRKAKAKKNMFSTDMQLKNPSADGQGNGGTSRYRSGHQVSMLEQVLNEKKMALMQSPVVLEFLQKQQQKKHEQQRHQGKPWGLPVQNYGHPSQR